MKRAVRTLIALIVSPHIASRRDLRRYVVLVTTLATVLALVLDTTVQYMCFESWAQLYRQWILDVVVTGATAVPVTIMIGTTHRALLAEKLAYKTLSETDPLTALPNRRHFMNSAGADAHLKVLAIIDVDRFKTINDDFGHDTGDHVLRAIAAALSAALQPDYMAGRLGGEEFAAYAPATLQEDFVERIEAFRAAIAGTPIRLPGHRIPVTVSVGIAVQRAGEPLSRLFVDADTEMYGAKSAGRNRVHRMEPCRDAGRGQEIASHAA